MADLNKVMLLGRLTRDPQLRYLPNQSAVVDFGFAVGRKFKLASGEEREETAFVDCSCFGKQGEVINQYCKKGKQLFIEGRLKFDQWDDKTSGQKRSKLTVVVETFILLGGRDGPGGGGRDGPGGGGGGDEGGGEASGGGERTYGRSGGYGGGGGNAGGAPRRPANAGRPAPANQPPSDGGEPPFGDEQQFKDDDIPF